MSQSRSAQGYSNDKKWGGWGDLTIDELHGSATAFEVYISILLFTSFSIIVIELNLSFYLNPFMNLLAFIHAVV